MRHAIAAAVYLGLILLLAAALLFADLDDHDPREDGDDRV